MGRWGKVLSGAEESMLPAEYDDQTSEYYSKNYNKPNRVQKQEFEDECKPITDALQELKDAVRAGHSRPNYDYSPIFQTFEIQLYVIIIMLAFICYKIW